MSGCTVKDVDPAEFVKALAAFFKKSGKLKVPDWVDVVKTGKHKELGPVDPDWYYTRSGKLKLQNLEVAKLRLYAPFLCCNVIHKV